MMERIKKRERERDKKRNVDRQIEAWTVSQQTRSGFAETRGKRMEIAALPLAKVLAKIFRRPARVVVSRCRTDSGKITPRACVQDSVHDTRDAPTVISYVYTRIYVYTYTYYTGQRDALCGVEMDFAPAKFVLIPRSLS